MRTNIEIDDELIAEAMELLGLRTKREAVDYALRELVQREGRKSILDLFGKYPDFPPLEELRTQDPLPPNLPELKPDPEETARDIAILLQHQREEKERQAKKRREGR
jgi:hypothetical protein